MSNFFKRKVIHQRVMGVVKERIATAQQKFDDGLDELEQEHEKALDQLEEKRKASEEVLADDLVKGIIGKIL